MKKTKEIFIGLMMMGCGSFLIPSGYSQETEKSSTVESPKTTEEKSDALQEKLPEEKVPVKEPEPAASEKQKEPAEVKTEPIVEKKLVGCVAPIKDLVQTYQKELDALQKLIEKWNNRLQSAMQRESLLAKEIKSVEMEYDKKKELEEKREKKEAARLKKQLERLLKEQKILKKELLKQCQELSAELGEFGKGTAAAIAKQIHQIRKEIETFSKGEGG